MKLQILTIKKFLGEGGWGVGGGGSNHTCLVVISLDSTLKNNENYYLRVFLKERKYIEKENLLGILLRTYNVFSSNSDEELIKAKYYNVF